MEEGRKVYGLLARDRNAAVGCSYMGFDGEENDRHYNQKLRGDKNHGRE